MNHFHIMSSIFRSIQIFSLIQCYHLFTTPAPILSWAYFNTPAILFNRSDSVAVLWLAATFARINKRKWSLKKKKKSSKTKCNCRRLQLEETCLYSRLPRSVSTIFSLKPYTQTFLTFQSKWAPEEELCLNNNSALLLKCLVYSFTWLISKSLSLISIQNSASITLNLGIF